MQLPLGPTLINTLRRTSWRPAGTAVFVNSKGQVEQRAATINALQAAQVAAGIVDGESGRSTQLACAAPLRQLVHQPGGGGCGPRHQDRAGAHGHATIGAMMGPSWRRGSWRWWGNPQPGGYSKAVGRGWVHPGPPSVGIAPSCIRRTSGLPIGFREQTRNSVE